MFDTSGRSRMPYLAIAGVTLMLVAAMIAGCSDDSGSGGQALGEVVAGDCLAGITASDGVASSEVKRVDCAESGAQYRVRQLVIVESVGDVFPGDEFLRNFAATTCGDDSLPSVVPDRQRWQSGDRFIVCLSEL